MISRTFGEESECFVVPYIRDYYITYSTVPRKEFIPSGHTLVITKFLVKCFPETITHRISFSYSCYAPINFFPYCFNNGKYPFINVNFTVNSNVGYSLSSNYNCTVFVVGIETQCKSSLNPFNATPYPSDRKINGLLL